MQIKISRNKEKKIYIHKLSDKFYLKAKIFLPKKITKEGRILFEGKINKFKMQLWRNIIQKY